MRFSDHALRDGVETRTIEGVPVAVTTPARTVADCFKYRNKIGLDVALEALREYRRARRSMDDLARAARVVRVANVMRPYLEAPIALTERGGKAERSTTTRKGTRRPQEDSMSAPRDLAQWQYPPPRDWEKFERFCCDFWKAIWRDDNAQRNGRTGQPQAGVDVSGQIDEKGWGGVQCKKKDAYADDALTVAELRRIVQDAKRFKPALASFTVAYTGHSDQELQEVARVAARSRG